MAKRRFLLLLPTFFAASVILLAAACSGDDEVPDSPGQAGDTAVPGQGGADGTRGAASNLDTSLEISAEGNKFNKDKLTAPANTRITVAFENKDDGVLHNVSFYRSEQARDPIHVGEFFAGVGSRTYEFQTPAPGSYFLRCDVHPDTMNATFSVK